MNEPEDTRVEPGEVQLNEEDLTPVIVPWEQLRPDTLRALIEDFVTRDGAVQGHRDHTLEGQTESVLRQLKSGKIVVLFDPAEEACSLVPTEYLRPAK